MSRPPSRSAQRGNLASADTPEPAPEATTAKDLKAIKSATKKRKLIRDSFTFPETDYALIDQLTKRALDAGREAKKSEVLRAALTTLANLPTAALLQALDGIEKLTPGRPAR